jgi:hypothetical protein
MLGTAAQDPAHYIKTPHQMYTKRNFLVNLKKLLISILGPDALHIEIPTYYFGQQRY